MHVSPEVMQETYESIIASQAVELARATAMLAVSSATQEKAEAYTEADSIPPGQAGRPFQPGGPDQGATL